MYISNPSTHQSRNMATSTLALHTGARDQRQLKQLQSRTHANTNGRKAFYDVSDALQETGNRGREFDTIVLETSAETGEFERYVVFKQHITKPTMPMATSISSAAAAALYAIFHKDQVEEPKQPNQDRASPERIRVDAIIILYDTDTEKFYSDGAYHKHTFCPSADGFVSVSDEHIANEKFKFYKKRV
jgi:hypothetical protein